MKLIISFNQYLGLLSLTIGKVVNHESIAINYSRKDINHSSKDINHFNPQITVYFVKSILISMSNSNFQHNGSWTMIQSDSIIKTVIWCPLGAFIESKRCTLVWVVYDHCLCFSSHWCRVFICMIFFKWLNRSYILIFVNKNLSWSL